MSGSFKDIFDRRVLNFPSRVHDDNSLRHVRHDAEVVCD